MRDGKEMESLSKRDKVLSLIGLAMKAGKCSKRRDNDRKRDEIRKSEDLSLSPGDASENTKKNSGYV